MRARGLIIHNHQSLSIIINHHRSSASQSLISHHYHQDHNPQSSQSSYHPLRTPPSHWPPSTVARLAQLGSTWTVVPPLLPGPLSYAVLFSSPLLSLSSLPFVHNLVTTVQNSHLTFRRISEWWTRITCFGLLLGPHKFTTRLDPPLQDGSFLACEFCGVGNTQDFDATCQKNECMDNLLPWNLSYFRPFVLWVTRCCGSSCLVIRWWEKWLSHGREYEHATDGTMSSRSWVWCLVVWYWQCALCFVMLTWKMILTFWWIECNQISLLYLVLKCFEILNCFVISWNPSMKSCWGGF